MDPNERSYTNGEITVHWKPSACIHATTCYRELIEVFNPRKRPWVNMQGAPSERIIDIVRKCPTDALTYDWNDPSEKSDKPPIAPRVKQVEIRIMKNGPYVVRGDFRVTGPDGKKMKPVPVASFCGCGASKNKPFCDGSHRGTGL